MLFLQRLHSNNILDLNEKINRTDTRHVGLIYNHLGTHTVQHCLYSDGCLFVIQTMLMLLKQKHYVISGCEVIEIVLSTQNNH